MKMKVVISSGKGGTGKTLIATNLARLISARGGTVAYLDCDVEEPDGHLFLKLDGEERKKVLISTPAEIDQDRCINCRRCADICNYNAIVAFKDKTLLFKELCHSCFGCTIVCPEDAIVVRDREIGEIITGKSGSIEVCYGLLRIGEAGNSPRMVSRVKEHATTGMVIMDSPPGTSCPVVETVKRSDLCVLVADPTPFSVNDLAMSVDMCREIGIEPVVFVNRSGSDEELLEDYCRREELEVIGRLPDDRKIAESYSRGELVIDALPEYRDNFEELYRKIKTKLENPPVLKKKEKKEVKLVRTFTEQQLQKPGGNNLKELVIISGKGGTGKTSLAGCFAVLAKNRIIADCDVDAADLHLILEPDILFSDVFSAGIDAEIDQGKCTRCGRCAEECRFGSIEERPDGSYYIPPIECEGCGVCLLVCPADAVLAKPSRNGVWYVSDTRAGMMTHARLYPAEENSGRMVTLLKDKARDIAGESDRCIIIDGSPGTGCPVIASLAGAHYALIVTEPTPSGLYDLDRIIDVTKHFGISAGVVVNKYDLNLDMTEEIRKLSEQKDVEFISKIPYNNAFNRAQSEKLTVVEYDDEDLKSQVEEIWRAVLKRMQ